MGKPKRDEWMGGFVCALACVMRQHHEPVVVRDAAGCIGGMEAIRKSGADPTDIAWVDVAFGAEAPSCG